MLRHSGLALHKGFVHWPSRSSVLLARGLSSEASDESEAFLLEMIGGMGGDGASRSHNRGPDREGLLTALDSPNGLATSSGLGLARLGGTSLL